MNSLQQVTLQVALIVAVVGLWFELKNERKARDTQFLAYAAQLEGLAKEQTRMIAETNETMRFAINLMKDRADLPVLSSKIPDKDGQRGPLVS